MNETDSSKAEITTAFFRRTFGFESNTPITCDNLQDHIDLIFSRLNKADASNIDRSGIIGHDVVHLDPHSATDGILLNTSFVEVDSDSAFASIRANACVCSGRWMFEVTLGTAGLQHIGWSRLGSVFSHEKGVGETSDSYAYDGKRGLKWNQGNEKYGQHWSAGDVIGCCIDLDEGSVHYIRNGMNLGIAFRDLPRGPGIAYFPTISLQHYEKAYFNFGSYPFQYPMVGFQPFQGEPSTRDRKLTKYMIQCYENLIRFEVAKREDGDDPLSSELQFSRAVILERLLPCLRQKYLLIECIIPFIYELMLGNRLKAKAKTEEDEPPQLSLIFLEDLYQFMEEHEFDYCIHTIMTYLSEKAKTTFCFQDTYQGPKAYLALAVEITQSFPAKCSWINSINFLEDLEGFFSLKQPNATDLQSALPTIACTASDKAEKEKHMEIAKHRLLMAITSVEHFQLVLFELLIMDSSKSLPRLTVVKDSSSSREATLSWLRRLRQKNRNYRRSVQQSAPFMTSLSTLSCVYYLLLHFLHSRGFFRRESERDFPMSMWFVPKYDMEATRIGGQVSDLVNVFEPDIRMLLSRDEYVNFECEVFAIMIFFYQVAISIKMKNLLTMVQNQFQSIAQLEDAEIRIQELGSLGTRDEGVLRMYNVFKDDVAEIVRHVTWNRLIYYNHDKIQIMFESLHYVNHVITRASDAGWIYRFVPELYLEYMLDGFHTLRRVDSISISSNRKFLSDFVDFFVCHFRDERLINVDIKDLILQSITLLLQYPQYSEAFQGNRFVEEALLKNLLIAYDQHNWLTVTNLFLVFWKGEGMCDSAPSQNMQYYRQLFAKQFAENLTEAGRFLTRLMNNLNLCFTEFGVLLREICHPQPTAAGPTPQMLKKCTVMFEYSCSLLRLLEFMCDVAPYVFLKNQEVNLTLLCEILVSMLHRISVGREGVMMDAIKIFQIKELEPLLKEELLAPIASILALLHDAGSTVIDLQQTHSISSWISQDPSYSLNDIQGLLCYQWKNPEDVRTKKRLSSLHLLICDLEADESGSDDLDDLDPQGKVMENMETCDICYSHPQEVYFLPCQHRSCKRCVTRHMVNSVRCFMCNTQIESVEQIVTKGINRTEEKD